MIAIQRGWAGYGRIEREIYGGLPIDESALEANPADVAADVGLPAAR